MSDERVPAALFEEIREVIADATPGYFLVPFDNYVGERLVKFGWGGSWGVGAAPRLSSRGAKRWGAQRVHPSLELEGPKRWLRTPSILARPKSVRRAWPSHTMMLAGFTSRWTIPRR